MAASSRIDRGHVHMSKTISFWPFFWLTFKWTHPIVKLYYIIIFSKCPDRIEIIYVRLFCHDSAARGVLARLHEASAGVSLVSGAAPHLHIWGNTNKGDYKIQNLVKSGIEKLITSKYVDKNTLSILALQDSLYSSVLSKLLTYFRTVVKTRYLTFQY